jgi:hypothetical protein
MVRQKTTPRRNRFWQARIETKEKTARAPVCPRPPQGINSGLLKHGGPRLSHFMNKLTPFSCPLTSKKTVSLFGPRPPEPISIPQAHSSKSRKRQVPRRKAKSGASSGSCNTGVSVKGWAESTYGPTAVKQFKNHIGKVVKHIRIKQLDNSFLVSEKLRATGKKQKEYRKHGSANEQQLQLKKKVRRTKVKKQPLDEGKYAVKCIKKHQILDSGVMFLVIWKDKNAAPTWEPLHHVAHLLPTLYPKKWAAIKKTLPAGFLMLFGEMRG